MPHHDLQEALQPLPPVLDDVVAEAVREDLAGKRGDGNAGALTLQNVAEVFEVGVAAADGAVLELEGGNVGPADNLVVRVHAAGCAVGLGIADLGGEETSVSRWKRCLVRLVGRSRWMVYLPLSPGNSLGVRKAPRSSAGEHLAWLAFLRRLGRVKGDSQDLRCTGDF